MNITDHQVRSLLEMLALTEPDEVDCDGCLRHMAEFAEAKLVGKTIPEGLKCIEDHLQRCGECREEYEALLTVLGGDVIWDE